MAKNDTVKLTHPNGTTVSVRGGKVELLEKMGFTKPTSTRSTSNSGSGNGSTSKSS